MELSRERKVFIGIFGTAIAALGIDRGLLGPSEASAATPTLSALSEEPITSEADLTVQTGGIGQTISIFAQRLQELGGSESVDPAGGGDAFSVPAAWLAVESTASTGPTPQAPAGPPSFKVSSVMPTQSGGIAVIEGKTYRKGEQVGAFTLEAVEPRSVVLKRGDSLYRVALDARP